MANDFRLEQTKSKFTLSGVVSRIDNENAYREGVIQKGRNQGSQYRSIRFGVKTSERNEVFVELFGMEKEKVYGYSYEKKESKSFSFDQRKNIPEEYRLIGTSLGLGRDDDGKLIRSNCVEFDAVEEIYNNIENGDSVFIVGELQFSTYTNKSGEEVEQTQHVIKNLSIQKNPIDFESDRFAEVTDFEQEIIFVDAIHDKDQGKVFVTGRTIGFADRWNDATFVIDVSSDKDLQTLGKSFLKKLKFGDFIQIYGKIINTVELVEMEEEVDTGNIFGGKSKPKSLQSYSVKNYINELQIIGVDPDTYETSKYSEEDFFVEELVQDNTGNDPFAKFNSGKEELEEEDLPF